MTESIENNLKSIDALELTDQYNMILRISEDIKILILKDKNDSSIALLKQVLDKTHELRYKLAYNKATTDIGRLDVNLKKSWESLKVLLES